MAHTVYVAETTCFTLFRVMQTASPVDRNVALIPIQARSTFHAATRANSTEFKKSIENGTVVSDVVSSLLLRIIIHVVRRDFS